MVRVLVAGPPRKAVGGVSAYTAALLSAMPEARAFDQWWPANSRSTNLLVRIGIHVLGLLRWVLRLTTRRTDVIHLQVTSPGLPRDLWYLNIARLLGVPVAAHLHTSGFFGPETTEATRRRFREVVDGADVVIVMSRTAADEIAAGCPDATRKLRVVPNPVPPMSEVEHPGVGPNGGCRFLCVGEISDLKGQDVVASCVDQLAEEGLDVSLELVGPMGALRSDSRAALENSPHVVLSGVQRGACLVRRYLVSDVFVLFSRTEAEPMAMLESMAIGLPVIMTSVGSIPDTLAEAAGMNPLVDPTDREGLCAAMRMLAGDAAARRRIGAQNHEWAIAARSIEGHVEALRSVYSCMWSEPDSRGRARWIYPRR